MHIAVIFCMLSLLLFCVFANNQAPKRSFAASTADMEALPKLEQVLIKRAQKYINELNTKLNITKNTLRSMSRENFRALKSSQNPVEYTLASFSVLRRLHVDWVEWLDFLNASIGIAHVDAMNNTLKKAPTLDDVKAAAGGLQRIQVAYNLHIDEMAKGKLGNWRNDSKLTPLDLNTIGLLLYSQGGRENAVNWLESSLRPKFDKDLYIEVFRKSIKRFYYDYKAVAMKINKTDFKELKDIQAVSRRTYKKLKIRSPDDSLVKSFNFKVALLEGQTNIKSIFQAYRRTCRGRRRPINYFNKLVCFYKNDSPFLKIAPNKVEIQNYQPLILLMYDVMSNKEISQLKKVSKYNMTRAQTFREKGVATRNAKTLTITDSKSGFNFKNWQNRLKSILGFKFLGVEPAQVINYGIGGHAGLHYDTMEKSMEQTHFGHRLISMKLYLSDVAQGGATVFPLLDLSIFPRKGAALFWINSYSDDDETDYRTMHATCPVIRGSKWILSLWIHKNEIFNLTASYATSNATKA